MSKAGSKNYVGLEVRQLLQYLWISWSLFRTVNVDFSKSKNENGINVSSTTRISVYNTSGWMEMEVFTP